MLQDPTRFYGILDKNAMESMSIANKILQDPKRSCKILQDPTRSYKILRDTRQKCFGIHINRKPTRFYGILSFKILRDTRQTCYGIHINSKQDPTRFYGILDKNAMESISIANKILQDPKRSCKILQDPTRSYKILRDTRQTCYGIHINSKQDPTRS